MQRSNPEGFNQPYRIEAISGGRERQIAPASGQISVVSHGAFHAGSGQQRSIAASSEGYSATQCEPDDSRLAMLVTMLKAAWPDLPEDTKHAIAEMVGGVEHSR
jgi:hypothetical protein